MFTFCQNNIKGINFMKVEEDFINGIYLKLTERFLKAKTIQGSRDDYHFVPDSEFKIKIHKTSNSLQFRIEDIQELPSNSKTARKYKTKERQHKSDSRTESKN